MLYVTQDYREAMAIADRIAVLIDGRLAQVATPADIYAQPGSVAIARLFGDPTINLAEVSPVAEHGMLSAVVAGARMRLELPNLLRRGTASVPYVTQHQPEAKATAARIAVLMVGPVPHVVHPADLYGQPGQVAPARLGVETPTTRAPV